MTATPCPDFAQLQAFVIGDVPESALQAISEHVESCERCAEVLGTLDDHADELVNGLSELRRFDERPTLTLPPKLLNAGKGLGPKGDGGEVSLDPGRRLARLLEEKPCLLGRFELETELGVGSFGHVFRATDNELGRTVAVKVQRAGSFADDDDVERFLREAKSAAQLKHPGIVALHDTGRTEDDVCFLVTEYIDGTTLQERLASGPMDHRESAALVIRIAESLQYAHEHGVIHRDVKPSNILIDEAGMPHVADFGLAKRDASDTMTSDGRMMGTPAYMSPEQAGDSHSVDARSDVYSLGAILYEMLTGEPPFQGNRRMLLLAVLEDEARPPRQLDDSIPRDLETICLKAMAKSPGHRYQTAKELADDLKRFVSGEPIKARPLGYVERFWRWCRRYPAAASLLLAGPVGSLFGFLYLSALSTDLVHATALDSVRMDADMLERLNNYYSEEVVGRLDWKKINVTHEYKQEDNSLPLPFTFMIDAGHYITQGESGMQVRIYSEHPWRKQGGPQDDFECKVLPIFHELDTLKRELSGEERSFHEFTQLDGRPVVRYARAQVMKASCVKCHNNHQKSPKKDWKEGDVAGVLLLTRPLERDISRTRSGFRGAFYLMGGVAVTLAALSLMLLLTARKRTADR